MSQLEIFNSKQRNSSFTNEKVFLVHLESFLKQKGRPITTVALQLANLFRLYHSVRDLGGFVAVTQSKFWPRLSLELMGKVSSDLILCKLYVNNLLDWECEFDRGGLDAKSVLQQVKLELISYILLVQLLKMQCVFRLDTRFYWKMLLIHIVHHRMTVVPQSPWTIWYRVNRIITWPNLIFPKT